MDVRRRSGKLARAETRWGYFFIMPCIIGLVLFAFGPMIFSIYISLSEWNIITPVRFIGITNYINAFKDPLIPHSLGVTFYYCVLAVPLGLVVTFLLANLLNTGVKGMSLFRTIYYIPAIVPAVASSALWMNMFSIQYGLINNVLKLLNLPTFQFLNSRSQVIPSMVIMSVWGAGSGVIIYLAGLQGISKTLYEAAEIDGAGAFRRFFHITIPMMTPIIFFNFLMGIIGGLQTFGSAYIMTNGGPANASLFISILIYRSAFTYFRMGYASAMSWILFVIIAILTVVVFRTSNRWVFYESKD
ncbi:MAG: sugar ABC transporter permease [Treponema sp.]|jgi:multiple sugar transport system permease protein|nr:sugar ABC transporter permease [Treponema sp.]